MFHSYCFYTCQNYVCSTDQQYIVPTSGNPIRGLIQDHVASAVKLTQKNTFLTRADFQQLVYVAVTGLPGSEVCTSVHPIIIPKPTILKPVELWTGKQVISTLVSHLCRSPLPPLHLDSKSKTPATAFGAEQGEHIVIFRFNELLTGVLDKTAIGNVSLGIVHAIYELYGATLCGIFLNGLGRLLTYYLQQEGHTCGIADLVLQCSADKKRLRLLEAVECEAQVHLYNAVVGDRITSGQSSSKGGPSPHEITDTSQINEDLFGHKIAMLMRGSSKREVKARIDGLMQSVINKGASDVIKACLPAGLQTGFPKNNFSMMVLTGAKGSSVNQSQISCFLGQQALEGQRVPVMISGKTLPSFRSYDIAARASGFITDRFLSGVKPQEYYFHCMAGREGLVDTAVKTSRSGYLQRCLVKHLEDLKIAYDNTVRDSANNVIQFLYGEDGIDVTNSHIKLDRLEIRHPVEDGMNISSSRVEIHKSLRLDVTKTSETDRDLFDLETDDGASFVELYSRCWVRLKGVFGDQVVLSSTEMPCPDVSDDNEVPYAFEGQLKEASLIFSIDND